MNKIIRSHQIDIAVCRSATAESIQKKKEIQKYDHITRGSIFRFLWMDMELTAAHREYLMNTYTQLRELRACILEFREIYKRKNMPEYSCAGGSSRMVVQNHLEYSHVSVVFVYRPLHKIGYKRTLLFCSRSGKRSRCC